VCREGPEARALRPMRRSFSFQSCGNPSKKTFITRGRSAISGGAQASASQAPFLSALPPVTLRRDEARPHRRSTTVRDHGDAGTHGDLLSF
jgi:hypothetical protein